MVDGGKQLTPALCKNAADKAGRKIFTWWSPNVRLVLLLFVVVAARGLPWLGAPSSFLYTWWITRGGTRTRTRTHTRTRTRTLFHTPMNTHGHTCIHTDVELRNSGCLVTFCTLIQSIAGYQANGAILPA